MLFIQRNCELQQEFGHCHPKLKFKVNQIYNSSFTGSPLWGLFSKQADMFEKSWNVSVRNMFGLPLSTHRYFIEPISESLHLKAILIQRFLSFIGKIKKGKKNKLKHILKIVQKDTRSTTGNNLRQILLLTEHCYIEDLSPSDAQSITYKSIDDEDQWNNSFMNLWMQNMVWLIFLALRLRK